MCLTDFLNDERNQTIIHKYPAANFNYFDNVGVVDKHFLQISLLSPLRVGGQDDGLSLDQLYLSGAALKYQKGYNQRYQEEIDGYTALSNVDVLFGNSRGEPRIIDNL